MCVGGCGCGCVHVGVFMCGCVIGYVCVGRELGRENAVACDCNTTAMGSCCTVMHTLYHGLCVSVLGVWEGGVAILVYMLGVRNIQMD